MKLSHWLLFILFAIITSCTAKTQNFVPDQKELKQQIIALNQQINSSYQNQEVTSLLKLYHKEITFCPEYKPAILNKERLQQFYADWWKINTIQQYQKEIYEVQAFGNFILEDGHFKLSYLDTMGQAKQYDGMYLIIWKRNTKGQLHILSEGFCSDKYRQPKDMPYASVGVFEQLDYPQKKITKSLEKMVYAANDNLIKIVETGDSEGRIKGFTDDAVYLHHFEEMMVGIEVLKPYLRKTYRPEAEIFVAHKLGRIYDLGAYALVHGHYKGGWSAYGGGTFEGNFIKLQRKEKNGTLKTYRSWTNNDR